MKPSWKEILVIAVLAVLATLLSLIYGRMEGCLKVNCSPGEVCPLISCVALFVRGWPIPIYQQGFEFNDPLWSGLIFSLAIVDFLFYFVLFWFIWFVIKFVARRLKK